MSEVESWLFFCQVGSSRFDSKLSTSSRPQVTLGSSGVRLADQSDSQVYSFLNNSDLSTTRVADRKYIYHLQKLLCVSCMDGAQTKQSACPTALFCIDIYI